MRKTAYLIALVSSAVLSGCATPGKYTWGNYERSLYQYYKAPANANAHQAELAAIIEGASRTGAKVAPGLHAEYGFLLLQQGKAADARIQFEREQAAWPEAAQLMSTMIRMTENKANNTDKVTAK